MITLYIMMHFRILEGLHAHTQVFSVMTGKIVAVIYVAGMFLVAKDNKLFNKINT